MPAENQTGTEHRTQDVYIRLKLLKKYTGLIIDCFYEDSIVIDAGCHQELEEAISALVTCDWKLNNLLMERRQALP